LKAGTKTVAEDQQAAPEAAVRGDVVENVIQCRKWSDWQEAGRGWTSLTARMGFDPEVPSLSATLV